MTGGETADEPVEVDLCPGCGRVVGSFACRIRHLHMNTGDAKADRD